MTLERLLSRKTLYSGLALVLTACSSPNKTGPSKADFISGLATVAQVAGLPRTLDQTAFLAGAKVVADHVSDKESTSLSASIVNVGTSSNSTQSQNSYVDPLDQPYDWSNVLLDGRVTDASFYNSQVVFSLPFKTSFTYGNRQDSTVQYDLFLANSDGTNLKRLTYTPWTKEINPQFLERGTKVEFDVTHVDKASPGECDVVGINIENIIGENGAIISAKADLFCQTHQASLNQIRRKKVMNLESGNITFVSKN